MKSTLLQIIFFPCHALQRINGNLNFNLGIVKKKEERKDLFCCALIVGDIIKQRHTFSLIIY